MEENKNPKSASKGDLPKDMWDDDPQFSETNDNSPPVLNEVTTPQPEPVQTPAQTNKTPDSSSGIGVHVPDHHIGTKRSKFGWIPGFLFSIVLILGAGYAGWYFWPNILDWVDNLFTQSFRIDDPEEQNLTTRIDTQVIWQDKQQIDDLGLTTVASAQSVVPGALPIGGVGSTAEYYKVGQFRDGPYQNGNVIVTLVHHTGDSGLKYDHFYRFAMDNAGSVFLLANHSPKLFEDDPLDDSKFTVDNDYIIESLVFPKMFTDPQFGNQPLMITDSISDVSYTFADKWFNDELTGGNWRVAYSHPELGVLYTDPEPTTIPTLGPSDGARNGFYFQAPDGTIKTYLTILDNVFGNDFAGSISGVPEIQWRIGGTNQEKYWVGDVGTCYSSRFISVMPNFLMDELIIASKDGVEPVVYELRDSNHEMLKELYGHAMDRVEHQSLTYEEFIDSHPLFFWKDVFGRLLRFQNTKFNYRLGCA